MTEPDDPKKPATIDAEFEVLKEKTAVKRIGQKTPQGEPKGGKPATIDAEFEVLDKKDKSTETKSGDHAPRVDVVAKNAVQKIDSRASALNSPLPPVVTTGATSGERTALDTNAAAVGRVAANAMAGVRSASSPAVSRPGSLRPEPLAEDHAEEEAVTRAMDKYGIHMFDPNAGELVFKDGSAISMDRDANVTMSAKVETGRDGKEKLLLKLSTNDGKEITISIGGDGRYKNYNITYPNGNTGSSFDTQDKLQSAINTAINRRLGITTTFEKGIVDDNPSPATSEGIPNDAELDTLLNTVSDDATDPEKDIATTAISAEPGASDPVENKKTPSPEEVMEKGLKEFIDESKMLSKKELNIAYALTELSVGQVIDESDSRVAALNIISKLQRLGAGPLSSPDRAVDALYTVTDEDRVAVKQIVNESHQKISDHYFEVVRAQGLALSVVGNSDMFTNDQTEQLFFGINDEQRNAIWNRGFGNTMPILDEHVLINDRGIYDINKINVFIKHLTPEIINRIFKVKQKLPIRYDATLLDSHTNALSTALLRAGFEFNASSEQDPTTGVWIDSILLTKLPDSANVSGSSDKANAPSPTGTPTAGGFSSTLRTDGLGPRKRGRATLGHSVDRYPEIDSYVSDALEPDDPTAADRMGSAEPRNPTISDPSPSPDKSLWDPERQPIPRPSEIFKNGIANYVDTSKILSRKEYSIINNISRFGVGEIITDVDYIDRLRAAGALQHADPNDPVGIPYNGFRLVEADRAAIEAFANSCNDEILAHYDEVKKAQSLIFNAVGDYYQISPSDMAQLDRGLTYAQRDSIYESNDRLSWMKVIMLDGNVLIDRSGRLNDSKIIDFINNVRSGRIKLNLKVGDYEYIDNFVQEELEKLGYAFNKDPFTNELKITRVPSSVPVPEPAPPKPISPPGRPQVPSQPQMANLDRSDVNGDLTPRQVYLERKIGGAITLAIQQNAGELERDLAKDWQFITKKDNLSAKIEIINRNRGAETLLGTDFSSQDAQSSQFVTELAAYYNLPAKTIATVLDEQKRILELRAQQESTDKKALQKGLGKGAAYFAVSMGLATAGVGAIAGLGLLTGARLLDNLRLDRKTKRAMTTKLKQYQVALSNNTPFRAEFMGNLTAALQLAKEEDVGRKITQLSNLGGIEGKLSIAVKYANLYAPELVDYYSTAQEHDQNKEEVFEETLKRAGVLEAYRATFALYEVDQATQHHMRTATRSRTSKNWLDKLSAPLRALTPNELSKRTTSTLVYASAGVLARSMPGVRVAMGALAGWKLGGLGADYLHAKSNAESNRDWGPSQLASELGKYTHDLGQLPNYVPERISKLLSDKEFRANQPEQYVQLREAHDKYVEQLTHQAQHCMAAVTLYNEQFAAAHQLDKRNAKLFRIVKLGSSVIGSVLGGLLANGGADISKMDLKDAFDFHKAEEFIFSRDARVRPGSMLDHKLTGYHPPTQAEIDQPIIARHLDRTSGEIDRMNAVADRTDREAAAASHRPNEAIREAMRQGMRDLQNKSGATTMSVTDSSAPAVNTAEPVVVGGGTGAVSEAGPAATTLTGEPTVLASEATPVTDEQIKTATVGDEQGIWHALKAQLADKETAKHFGWDDKGNQQTWMTNKIAELLNKTTVDVDGQKVPIIDLQSGKQLWVMEPGKYAFVLGGTEESPTITIYDADTKVPISDQTAIDAALKQVPGQVRQVAEAMTPGATEPSATAELTFPANLDEAHVYKTDMTEDQFKSDYFRHFLGDSTSDEFIQRAINDDAYAALNTEVDRRWDGISDFLAANQAPGDTDSGDTDPTAPLGIGTSGLKNFEDSRPGTPEGTSTSGGGGEATSSGIGPAIDAPETLGNATVVDSIHLQRPVAGIIRELTRLTAQGPVTEFGLHFAREGRDIVVSTITDLTNKIEMTPEVVTQLKELLPTSDSTRVITASEFQTIIDSVRTDSSAAVTDAA